MPFADELLGPIQVADLAAVLHAADPGFDPAPLTVLELTPLALSARVTAVRDVLAQRWTSPAEVAAVLTAALPDDRLSGWMIWPVTELVTLRCAGDPEAFELGLEWLRRLTHRLTAEFAIRGFLLADLDRTLATVQQWVDDPDEHVRRLASEGTRVRLPWGRSVPALTARPGVTRALVDALAADPAEYVRRSVANHVNDLSRVDPGLVLDIVAGWQRRAAQGGPAPMIRHALRTLVKQGDPGALALLGFGAAATVQVQGPVVRTPVVPFPGRLEFEVTVHNSGTEPVDLVVDHVVHYVKANGTRAGKVFKGPVLSLAAGERRVLQRAQDFRPISTRRHHPGRHAVQVQVNGTRYDLAEFDLVMTSDDGPTAG